MKKQTEIRYFVTSVASIPVYKVPSKTEMYRMAAKDGWGTVYRDEENNLVCDEDCSADLYTKDGGYFGITPYEEINTKEMPKQAECAAIICSDSCGYSVWAEDFSKIHFFVTYDANGLIDRYRLEYGEDTQLYDGETEIFFEDLHKQDGPDWDHSYRAELPGTVEYQHKQEADALAQEAGETWMDAEQREQFRQVCNKIDRIKRAWDFICTMSSLEHDYDKKIITAARKCKKCFNFAQYETQQEEARREELLEDYRKYNLATADTADEAADSKQDVTSAAEAVAPEAENRKGQPQAQEVTAGEPGAAERKKSGGGAGPPPQEKGEQGVNSGAAV